MQLNNCGYLEDPWDSRNVNYSFYIKKKGYSF